MATRCVIGSTAVVHCPDHIHPVTYRANGQYAIGSYLMPQGLADAIVALSQGTQDSTAIDAANTAANAVQIHILDNDGPETLPWSSSDTRYTAYIKHAKRDG